MIPKIVHYIWFGDKPYPKKVKECMESWKKFLPDYKFILWNEKNFNVNQTRFTKLAYEKKKYAFVSDYVRVYALYKYGGWYLDTDVEIVRPLSNLENNKMVLGTDENGDLTALMGSEKGHSFWMRILDIYEKTNFVGEDGSLNVDVNNVYIQNGLIPYGYVQENKYQELEAGIVVFPDEYFHVLGFLNGVFHITSDTYAIHWHTLTWVKKKTHIYRFLRLHVFNRLIGRKASVGLFMFFHRIKRFLIK